MVCELMTSHEGRDGHVPVACACNFNSLAQLQDWNALAPIDRLMWNKCTSQSTAQTCWNTLEYINMHADTL